MTFPHNINFANEYDSMHLKCCAQDDYRFLSLKKYVKAPKIKPQLFKNHCPETKKKAFTLKATLSPHCVERVTCFPTLSPTEGITLTQN